MCACVWGVVYIVGTLVLDSALPNPALQGYLAHKKQPPPLIPA